MEAGGCALLVVVIAIVIAAAIAGSESMRRSRFRAMEFATRRWEGRPLQTSWFADPAFTIRVDGAGGRVDCNSGKAPWTRVRIHGASARRLRVVPEGFSAWLRRAFGNSDLNVGDADFDAAFWIETSDPAWARQLLDVDVRRGLMTVRHSTSWIAWYDVSLDVGSEGVMLRISRLLVGDANALGAFIDLAAAIFRKVRDGEAPVGIVLAAVETRAGSECPVCGHPVEADGRICPTCRTPHHADCWKYSGGCAIYGCEARARRPVA